MQIVFPVFFIFTIYSVVNTYLPVLLSIVGYNIENIGLLLAIFDIAGTFIAMPCVSLVSKSKNYGLALFLLLLPCIIMPFPLINFPVFALSAVCLSLYAIGYKSLIPVSDAIITNILDGNDSEYGKIRVVGSASFVLMSLILQFFCIDRNFSSTGLFLWVAVPAMLAAISIFFVPGLISGKTGSIPPLSNEQSAVSLNEDSQTFSPSFRAVIILLFIGFLALSPVNKFFSLYVRDFLHVNAGPGFWAVHAVVEIPFMIFASRIIRRYGSKKVLSCCTFAISVRLLVYIIFPSFWGALAGQLLNSLTFGLLHPAAISFICEHVKGKKQVTALAMYTVGANGIGNIIGSAVGGLVIAKYGFPVLFIAAAALPPLGILLFHFMLKKTSD